MRKDKAFSLIELSVVLAVVGLLIMTYSGYTTVRRSGDVNKLITTWQQYKQLTLNFRSIYNYWPGDLTSTQMVGRLKNTANNSYYAQSLPTANDWDLNCELRADQNNISADSLNAIRQLGFAFPEAGIQLDYTIPGSASETTVSTSLYTAANLYKIFQPIDLSVTSSAFLLFGHIQNDNSNISLMVRQISNQAAFSSAFNKLVDTKGDDGIPSAGGIRALGTNCISGTTYLGTNTPNTCALMFVLDNRMSL